MSTDLALAGTGFLLVPAPGGGPDRGSFLLELSRSSEGTLILELGPGAPGERATRLAAIDLTMATVEAAGMEGGAALTVLNGRGEATAVSPGWAPIELEPGDTVVVADCARALRYAPWSDGDAGAFRAWLRADAAEAACVRDAFSLFCESSGVPGPAIHDISLAIQETLDNAVEHAYSGRPRGVILVEARLDPGAGVLITVRDRGPAFDPTSAPPPDPAKLLETEKLGGLGLHLVRNLVDSLTYERRSGENRLTLARGFTRA